MFFSLDMAPHEDLTLQMYPQLQGHPYAPRLIFFQSGPETSLYRLLWNQLEKILCTGQAHVHILLILLKDLLPCPDPSHMHT